MCVCVCVFVLGGGGGGGGGGERINIYKTEERGCKKIRVKDSERAKPGRGTAETRHRLSPTLNLHNYIRTPQSHYLQCYKIPFTDSAARERGENPVISNVSYNTPRI